MFGFGKDPAKERKERGKSEKPTWTELSQRLRFSQTSITEWRKLPGAPQEPIYEEWTVFIEDNDLGGQGRKSSEARENFLTARVQKQNRLLDIEIAKKERALVDRAAVDGMLLQVSSLAKTVLYQKMERELPAKLVGLTPPEMSIKMREAADEISEIIANGFRDWSQTEP